MMVERRVYSKSDPADANPSSELLNEGGTTQTHRLGGLFGDIQNLQNTGNTELYTRIFRALKQF